MHIDSVIITGGVLLAYLIGSLPTSIWVGKGYFGIDIREHGSGNAGATNTFRVLGKKWGSIVMGVDVFKGFTATLIAYYLFYLGAIAEENVFMFKLILGLVAVTGHIFPVFERFKGGKGVATLLGLVLSLHIQVALLCLGIFIVVFALSKYVSLGSIIAAVAYPLLQIFVPRLQPEEPWFIAFAVAMCVMVLFTHRKNIVRLLRGEENKVQMKRA